jgi:hypothetical protein
MYLSMQELNITVCCGMVVFTFFSMLVQIFLEADVHLAHTHRSVIYALKQVWKVVT